MPCTISRTYGTLRIEYDNSNLILDVDPARIGIVQSSGPEKFHRVRCYVFSHDP